MERHGYRRQKPAVQVQYEVYGMSRESWLMLRDVADWEFATAKGLPPLMCTVYEDAVRFQAETIIARGVQ